MRGEVVSLSGKAPICLFPSVTDCTFLIESVLELALLDLIILYLLIVWLINISGFGMFCINHA